MAFQPIVDVRNNSIYAYEALVRGVNGEGAGFVLEQINDINRYSFDQACRVRAIEMASALGVECRLSINFLPNAVYDPKACVRLTVATARRCGFPIEKIIFELTEEERSNDLLHLKTIFQEYSRLGFMTAIDDFGSGYAGLEMLATFLPAIVKIDMLLIRSIDTDRVKQAIVEGIVQICEKLDIEIIGEGVETVEELAVLRGFGITLFQGYLFAKPGFECLPEVRWPAA
ncbi:MAG: EAL domain-containing protein [Comamonadaceae bacterium]|nr:MAG: EAL domain-containing protein [Comamonadaceae bacterium]